MENFKECPYCAEIVNIKARICKHCFSKLGVNEDDLDKDGTFVKVRIKAQGKIYYGDLFIPGHLRRVSDVINDQRPFLLLSNAREVTKSEDVQIGFLAINKELVHWVRLMGG